MNATFVTLARNSDLWYLAKSIRAVEDRFNWQFHYPWVFLNDEPFTDEFMEVTSSLTSGMALFGLVPNEHWSYPDWIDLPKAAEAREKMEQEGIHYGASESYRHMCRYQSGFFFRHPLMLQYEWYWRVEPDIELFCDIGYDVFRYMAENKKIYSFVISLKEYMATIPSLWTHVSELIGRRPDLLGADNALDLISDDNGQTYTGCHFWTNFEISNLNWLRSSKYLDFFDSLDRSGGFFYERWGDGPIHSIAAALMLRKDQIHFFDDIGYSHNPWKHCPNQQLTRKENKCYCDPSQNVDWEPHSCTEKFVSRLDASQ